MCKNSREQWGRRSILIQVIFRLIDFRGKIRRPTFGKNKQKKEKKKIENEVRIKFHLDQDGLQS